MKKTLMTLCLIAALNINTGTNTNSTYLSNEKDKKELREEKEQQFEIMLNNYYIKHKEPIDKWIELMKTPEGKRVVFDKFTLDIKDTINADKKSVRKYFSRLSRAEKKRTLTFLGRTDRLAAAFQRFDKYQEIIETPLEKRDLPEILRYIPVIESHLKPIDSKAKARGYWQILKGTGKGLTINWKVDERNSLIHSSEKGTELLDMGMSLYEGFELAATQYIVGNYGQTKYLEDMLDVKKEGKVFSSYSNIILFHQQNEFKPYDYDAFSKKFPKSSDAIWSKEIRKNKKNIVRDKEQKQKLYENYKNEVLGKDTTRTHIRSFFDFYNLNLNPDSVYWAYHDYLKTTKDNFDSPNYVPRLLATAVMHIWDFEYKKIEPINIDSIEVIYPSKKELVELLKDPEFRELNMHINKNAARKYDLSKETEMFKLKD